MQNLQVFLSTADPSPGEELREGLDPEMVTPGTLGFLAMLFVVILTVFLIRDMMKRVRRVRYREQVRNEDSGQADDGDGGTADGQPNDTAENSAAGPAEDQGAATAEDDGTGTAENRRNNTSGNPESSNGTDSSRKG